jgi:antitoxin CptB
MKNADLIKRLRYRSWHRGCKETDLILGRFADSVLDNLSPASLEIYEKLLNENDADIWDWVRGKETPAEYTELMEIIRKLEIVRT